jgi:hexosaminidase
MSASISNTLVPAPRCFQARPGALDLSRGLAVIAGPEYGGVAKLAAGWLSGTIAIVNAAGVDDGVADEAAGLPALHFGLDPAFAGGEEYRLEVSADGASIAASSTEGLVRGASSLRQLALSACVPGGDRRVPACLIEDGPRFGWRGFMLDTARNFFPVDFIERLLDLAALHKLNRFHWHLTDDQAWRLDLPGLPELARAGSRRRDRRFNWEVWKAGSYSPADVKRVVAFAAARGIVVVPEIETPGHALALLASHPELSCAAAMAEAAGGPAPVFLPEDRYGIFEDVLCAGNETVFGLLEKIADGVAELFPGPWVHAGGDEAPKARWLDCPRCAARMRELGLVDAKGAPEPERLQAWFMARMASIYAARGKRLVGWDEILDAEKDGHAGLPADAVVMSWRGYEGGLAGARLGHDVVMSPQTKACYLDHRHLDLPGEPGHLGVCTVRDSYQFEAIPPGLQPAETGSILGGQANVWSELLYFGKQAEYMIFPRLCALAESFWSPRELRDFGDFSRRLPGHLRRLDALGVNYYRGPLE